jgi:PAS domain S-box-containing protein
MRPPVPPNETERLVALRRYYILDTPPEAAFDRITAFSARLFSAPISLISLLDSAREWFKSTYGIDIRETPRDHSFCAHVTDRTLVVPNALEDPRFQDNPLVLGSPHIRFYAGAPLRTPDGFLLGTLSVIDTAPRPQFSGEQIELLESLAATVVDELELRTATVAAHKQQTRRAELSGQMNEMAGRLQLNEEVLGTVLETLPVGVWVTDREGRLLHGNPAARALWGGGPDVGIEEYDKFAAWRADSGERIAPDEWALARAIRRGEASIDNVIEIEDFHGCRKMISNSAAPLRDRAGAIVGAVCVNEDITDRLHAEEELRRVRDELRGLIEAAPLAIISISRDRTVRNWTPAAERMFGWTAAEATGRPYPIVPPGREQEFEEHCERMFRGDALQDIETVRRRKDGTLVDVNLSAAPLHDPDGTISGIIAIFADVSARKRVEGKARERERDFETMADSLPAFLVTKDRDSRYVIANRKLREAIGCTPEQLRGKTDEAFFPPESAAKYRRDDITVMDTGQTLYFEEKLALPDGSRLDVGTFKAPLWNDAGEVRGLVVMVFDLSEKKAMEAALKQSEERFRRAILDAPLPMMIHAEDGRILQLNRAWTDLSGYTTDDVTTAADWMTKACGWAGPEAEAEIRSLYDLQSSQEGCELPNRTKSGKTRTWAFSSAPLGPMADGVRMVITTATDVTEHRSIERQLAQAQKMEAIGQLAGGVAHDFNNLLTVIVGYSNMLLLTLHEADPARQQVQEIVKAAERATGLTRQLLAFSRKQMLQPANVDIRAVVRESERMLHRLIGEDIRIDLALSDVELRTVVDTGQLAQVIMNLAVNARDAMPEGGVLTIETGEAELTAEYAGTHPDVVPGSYVQLAVSDTGTGMDQQTMARIFEPFFTTKGAASGTGLGLSTVYGIVKQSKGHISVYSEKGRGTTFRVYLPRVFEGPRPAAAEQRPDSAHGAETLLLVEDDAMLRKLTSTILRRAGYKVIEAANGGEALLACERGPADIALMVTDVVMPGISGRELAQRVAVLRPAMRVLYTSGYTDRAVVSNGVLESGLDFIQKPFAPADLTARVRAVLDRNRD